MAKKTKGKANPKGLANLMPIQEVNARKTREERVASARKAGIASGKARSFKSIARELLTDEEKKELIQAQMEMAKRGNVMSFRVLIDIGDAVDDADENVDALSRSLEELARSMENDQ